MIIVLDTNLLVSAALNAGTARKAFDKALAIATIVRSEYTLNELVKTLEKPKLQKYLDSNRKQLFITNFVALSEAVQIKTSVNASRDTDDNAFLALAIDGNADCIVSGDKDLLILHPFQNIPILNPAIFLTWAEKNIV